MRPEDFQAVETLFDRALELDPAMREGFLAAAALELGGVVTEVRSLLAAHEDSGEFLAMPLVGRRLAPPCGEAWLGRQLGHWRLEALLGEGGMGSVLLGVRTAGDFPQKVAVKLADRFCGSPFLERRFHVERAILARLEHPGIARLLDGGSTAEGIPYLVMELADGTPIDRYCAERRLDLVARLKLFAAACDAVRHAHRHLVIHLDLKPEHVLVDGDGRPKLLDFGIAKLTSPGPGNANGRQTHPGSWAITPAYASPEQLTGGAVDTTSDVYSLGVVLYELLTGRQPRTPPPIGVLPLPASFTASPPRPSVLARQLAWGPDAWWRRAVAADLDAILEKALAIEPAARYASVEALALDLEHLLAGRPVGARRSTFAYRLGKGIVRHRLAVGLGALAATLLIAFSATSLAQARAIARERDRALASESRAEAVADFLADVVRRADPQRAGGHDVSVRDALDKSVERLDGKLASQPDLHGSLLHFVGSIYRGLGVSDRSRRWLGEALALRRELYGDTSLAVAQTELEVCWLESEYGDLDEAEGLCKQALSTLRRLAPASEPALIQGLLTLADIATRRMQIEQSASLTEEALRVGRASLEPGDPQLVVLEARHARGLAMLDRFEEAAAVAAGVAPAVLAPTAPRNGMTVRALDLLGDVAWMAGQPVEAAMLWRRGLELDRAIAPPGAPFNFRLSNDLGLALVDQGRIEEGVEALGAAVAAAREQTGPGSPATAVLTSNLIEVELARGNLKAAEQLAKEVLRATENFAPEGLGLDLLALRGSLHLAQGRAAAAVADFERVLAIRRTSLPADHSFTAELESRLGQALVAAGRGPEGLPLLASSHQTLLRKLGPDHAKTKKAAARLAEAASSGVS